MTRKRARELCIRSLASKICQNVRHADEGNRELEDWLQAERFIDAHTHIVDDVTGTCWPDTYSDQDFEQSHGSMIYRQAFLMLVTSPTNGLPKPPYL